MNFAKQETNKIYENLPKILRDEMLKMESEFDEKHPENSVPVPKHDLDAIDKLE